MSGPIHCGLRVRRALRALALEPRFRAVKGPPCGRSPNPNSPYRDAGLTPSSLGTEGILKCFINERKRFIGYADLRRHRSDYEREP